MYNGHNTQLGCESYQKQPPSPDPFLTPKCRHIVIAFEA